MATYVGRNRSHDCFGLLASDKMKDMTSFLKPQRKCGDCKACCTAISVEEIRKPFGAKCEHECEKGCAIYGKHPDSCQGYMCGWLMGFGDDTDRPDKIGAVLHHSMDDHGFWIQIHTIRKLTENEMFRLVLTAENIVVSARLRGIKIVRHDQMQNCNFEPDLKKYPGFANIPGKTVWKTWDDIHYFLESPTRKPLPMVT